MKKFFKKTEGFTLVELIVVIAILGILAGVGTVGYSGYIKKTNEAADNQLLAAVNHAFAAACLENGVDAKGLAGKTVDMPLVDQKVDVDNVQPYQTSFEKYYAGNEAAAFKNFTSLYFDYVNGVFADRTDSPYNQLSFDATHVSNVNNSTFMSESLGVAALLNQMNQVTAFAAGLEGLGGDLLAEVFESTEFKAYTAQTLIGDAAADMDDDEFEAAVDEKYYSLVSQIAKKNGVTEERAEGQLKANMAVLYAARKAQNMDQAGIKTLLSSGNAKGQIINNISSDTETAFAQAALAYGMYTSYAHSTLGSETAKINATNPLAALGAMDTDEGFRLYVQDTLGGTDLTGYQSALSLIDTSTSNVDAVSNLLVNGFGDGALIGAVQGALGSN